mgnify:CR=1 FL=1
MFLALESVTCDGLGLAGHMNDYGRVLLEAMNSLQSTALMDSTSEGADRLCKSRLAPLDKQFAQMSLIRTLAIKQAEASGGVPCKSCGRKFTTFLAYYSYEHTCIDSEEFFSHNRPT